MAADPTDKLEFPLYDMIFRPPTPWPYTPGGAFPQQQDFQGKPCPAPGNDAGGYAAALSYIAGKIGLSDYSSDLRAAYVALDQSTWSDEKVDLLGVQYAPGNGFTEAELCNLKAELQQEFDWLDNVKTVFDTYEKVLGSSGNVELADLEQIGEAIRTTVALAESGADVGWSEGGFVGNMISAALLAFNPDGTAVLAGWEAIVTAYELVRELVSGEGGIPVSDQVETTVEKLSHNVATSLSDAANGLVRLRDVIISDYGRLQAAGIRGPRARLEHRPGDHEGQHHVRCQRVLQL